MLQVDEKSPQDVVVQNNEKKEVRLSDYAGVWLVVYFYPKDNTPGCTVEAKEFRDLAAEFAKYNAEIVGVSKDSCASHTNFIEKYDLNFSLLADTEHVLMEAFGVWGERKFMGRTYMGTSRSTFLINPKGLVTAVWEKVKSAGHPEEVLETIIDQQEK